MSTAPPPAGQAGTGTGAPPPPVVGGAAIFVPPFDPMATSKAIEASTSPEVLAWLRAAWGEWDVRPQVAVALVYQACQAAGFTPQPDNNFRGFMAWIPSSATDAAQTRVITAAATPACQPASPSFPACLPAEEAEKAEESEKAEAEVLLESAKKTAKRNKKAARRARQRALWCGIAAAAAAVAAVIAAVTSGWAAFGAAIAAVGAGIAGLITGIKTYGGSHSRRQPRR